MSSKEQTLKTAAGFAVISYFYKEPVRLGKRTIEKLATENEKKTD